MNRIGPKVQSLIDNQNITQGSSNSQRKKEKKKERGEKKKLKSRQWSYMDSFISMCGTLIKSWRQNDGAQRAEAVHRSFLFFFRLLFFFKGHPVVYIVALEENNNSTQHDRHCV